MTMPFVNKVFTFKNPDGTEVSVHGWGDEHFARFETADGFTVVQDPVSGFFHYGKLSEDQLEMQSSGARVGTVDPRSLGFAPHLRVHPQQVRALSMAAREALGPKRRWEIRRDLRRSELQQRMLMTGGPEPAPPQHTRTGSYVGLCLLIQFPDVSGSITQKEVTDFCNKHNYSNSGNNGSVYDYYFDNSGGRLKYTTIVTAYYTAKNKRSYYTDETISYGTRAQELIKEALDNLKSQNFNFNQLSSDSGGYVFALNVFYAGDTVNNWAKGLWPHSSALSSEYSATASKKFSDYQITNIGSELSLHTYCHENGHMLCDFPDLYDYGYESKGDGNFCLMAYGGGNSKNPVQICAYLKYKAGWANQVTAIAAGTFTVPSGNNSFFIYTNPNKASEYFIVENRQQQGRDIALPDAGLAIWHIDELGSNNNEQMSSVNHYECALVQADNQFQLEHGINYGDNNDLYASPQAIRFADDTSPGAKWWNGSNSGLNMSQISASSVNMTFSAGAPPAVGDPFGYAFVGGTVVEQHNLFRSANGHIHALWFNFATGWHHEDRTMLLPGIPPAVVDPFGYAFIDKKSGLLEQHNLFRSADGHIHALWFNFATGWHHEDRTTLLPGIPPAVGDPFGYAFVDGTVIEQHNLFRSANGHIHALWFNFATGWHHEDRTTLLPGIPPAVGDPFGYAFIDKKSGLLEQHNLFRSADGHIHALWFNFATGWHHEDRTMLLPGIPPAVGDPFGYAFVDGKVVEQHNLFRSADGHIHALWFNFATGWHHEERR